MKVIILLATFLVGLITPAIAQPNCANRGEIIDHLRRDFNEVLIGNGLTNRGTVIEFFTTRDGETWTILLTMPDGNSCLLQAGENWRVILPKPLSSQL